MRKLIAKELHLVLGAVVIGPTFYGFAWPRWGVGVFVMGTPVRDRQVLLPDVPTYLVPTGGDDAKDIDV